MQLFKQYIDRDGSRGRELSENMNAVNPFYTSGHRCKIRYKPSWQRKNKETTKLGGTGETSIPLPSLLLFLPSSINFNLGSLSQNSLLLACLRHLTAVRTSLTHNGVAVYLCPRGVHEMLGSRERSRFWKPETDELRRLK